LGQEYGGIIQFGGCIVRAFTVLIPLCLFVFLAVTSPALAQSSLPRCEPLPQLQEALEKESDWELAPGETLAQLLAQHREILTELISQYPREVEPHRRLILETRWWADPTQLPPLLERYRQQGLENPDDPLALYLEGIALFHTDTPTSIQLLEAARSKAPNFGWPSLQLAEIYSSGKRLDKKKELENIGAFFATCPASADPLAQRLLAETGDLTLQARVASALSVRLSRETVHARLMDYETLWGLEFRSRPAQEQDALRLQVLEDVKRLGSLNTKPDAEMLTLLIKGYRQGGASPETVTAAEDRLLRQDPKSEEANKIVFARWLSNNKEPNDQQDAVAWASYNQAYHTAVRGWVQDFGDLPWVQYYWFRANFEGNDETLSEAEGITAMEGYMRCWEEAHFRLASKYQYPRLFPWQNHEAAEFLLNHRWRPDSVSALLREAELLFGKEWSRSRQDDNLTTEDLDRLNSSEQNSRQDLAKLTLNEAKVTGRPDDARRLEAFINGPEPKQEDLKSDYWWNRAKLAALQDHKLDALAYYQLALQKRQEAPRVWHGKLRDDLDDEARALWKEMGGTDTTWALWSSPARRKIQELTELRWERAQKPFPPFELADLSGKVWRLKDLAGKSLLINVWATWCGNCLAELPLLEGMYEKVKERADIQILTFNADENVGLVAPFVKEKGYTFPVLPAFSLVTGQLGLSGIPQNWIVDPKGGWGWTGGGFDSGDPNWMQEIMEKLESAQANK
jgi:thiol-disulfide isomerase/thioredoxin